MKENQSRQSKKCASAIYKMPEIAEIDTKQNMNDTKTKKILIAGADSYIGKSFVSFMCRWPGSCQADMLCTKGDSWKNIPFENYDAVLYISKTDDTLTTFRKHLMLHKADACQAVRIANRAKISGIEMFLYLSSLHVYSPETGMITKTSRPEPSDAYGRLRLHTEKQLWNMNSSKFRVAILRLPKIYGYKCSGSYTGIAKAAIRSCFFPKYNQKYSVIHIDNLTSAIRSILYYNKAGVYFPQNTSFSGTYDFALEISGFYGKKLKSIALFNPIIHLLIKRIWLIQNIFSGHTCSQSLNVPDEWLQVKNFRESIRLSESGWS